jgi:cytochrome c oxidase subunit III
MTQVILEVEEQEVAIHDGGGVPPSPPFVDHDFRDGQPFRTPQRAYTTGMLVAFGASSMFFLALISASVVHRGMPESDWMPLHPPSILWLTSTLAIVSSLTIVKARSFFKSGNEARFSRWWALTALLGVCFLFGQVLAWRHLVSMGIYMTTNPSVSFFYVLTVAHGLHLLGGVVALLWIDFRHTRIRSLQTATSVAAMYWHFVTVLWLCLFSFFLIGG